MNNACCSKDIEVFQFNSTRMDIEESIFSYVIVKNDAPLDQTGFSLEKNRKVLRNYSKDELICQLCKHRCTHGFTPVKDLESHLTRDLYIPEENFSPTHEPVVCSSCFDSLNTHGRFLESHPDAQGERISTSDEKDSLFYIKTEVIEIKSEDEDNGNSSSCDDGPSASHPVQNRQVRVEPVLELHNAAYTDSSRTRQYQCVICAYTTPYKRIFDCHLLNHEELAEVQIFQCNQCNFITKYKGYLLRHQLVHKDICEVRSYSCDMCLFQTKYKGSLAQHKKRKHERICYSSDWSNTPWQ